MYRRSSLFNCSFLDKMTIFDIDTSGDSHPFETKEGQMKISRSELLLIKNRKVECLSDFDSELRKRHPDIADIVLKTESHNERKNESRIEEKKIKEKDFWETEDQKDWDDEILDLLRNVSSLSNDDQIMSLAIMLKGPQERIELISSLVSHIESCLRKEFPNCKVIPYGSSATGFSFQDSDLDAFVDLQLKSLSSVCGNTREEEEEENHRGQERTRMVADTLRREERFRNARPILNARIPIIKMRDNKTGIECDINVVSSMGVINSKWINFCRTLDTKCQYLISVVKYIAIKQGIVASGRGDHLNSYTIVLMVIFFLQVRGILPSVETLQIGVEANINCGWNVVFDTDFNLKEWRKEANESDQGDVSVSSLLKSFFKFYICFPYDTHVICPHLGSPVKKYNLKFGYNLPKALEKAPHFGKRKVKLEVNKRLVIQDPFELTRNVSCGISEAHFGKFRFKVFVT